MSTLSHGSGCFLTNEALHYLQHPRASENKSVFQFFQQYEVICKHKASGDQETHEIDDEDHPGFKHQTLRLRNPSNPTLPQFSHWVFPNTASFGGCLYDLDPAQINGKVQKYS